MRLWWLLLGCLLAWPATAQPAWEWQLPAYEQQNLRHNREWIQQRRQQGESASAPVAVVAGAGVWYPGALALVTCLERSGVPCQVLDPLNLGELSTFRAVVLPGGYSAYQYYALGTQGCEKLSRFVQAGGRVLGICAGGYVLSKTVRYQGISYPYPLALFDGIADGPVAGLPIYPDFGPCRVRLTEAGKRLGLSGVEQRTFFYGSGPRFVGGSDVTVLLTYEDGTAAAISRPVGKGMVVAMGPHMEIVLPAAQPAEGCEPYLLKLLGF